MPPPAPPPPKKKKKPWGFILQSQNIPDAFCTLSNKKPEQRRNNPPKTPNSESITAHGC